MKRYFSREYLIKLREKFETIAPKTDRLLLRFVKASLPHLAGNSVESAVRRLWDRRRLVRVSPGVYKLAPPPKLTPAPAPEPAPPEPAPAPGDGHTDEEWYALLEAWAADQSSWNAKANGPPPNVVGNNVPPDIRIRFSDRLRKRQERARDREAAAAKQAAADAALRDRLLAVTNGNFVAGHAIDDVSPIKMAMEIVPFDSILSAIQYKTDKKLYPLNEPATSWRERRLLKAIAEHYARFDLVPRLVSAWSAARTTQKPTERAEASPAAEVAPEPKSAPSPFPPHPDAVPDDELGPPVELEAQAKASELEALAAAPTVPAPQEGDHRPVVEGRERILRAFKRSASPPPSAPQPRPVEPPWFAGPRPQPRLPEHQSEPMSREGWEMIIAGWRAGNVCWNKSRLGPEPGNHGCRVPTDILKSFGL